MAAFDFERFCRARKGWRQIMGNRNKEKMKAQFPEFAACESHGSVGYWRALHLKKEVEIDKLIF